MFVFRLPVLLLAHAFVLPPAVGQDSSLEDPATVSGQVEVQFPAWAGTLGDTALRLDDGRGTAYVVERSDNICGLDNPHQLTHPARVSYAALLAATPEMKTMKGERIKPSSPRGIQLRTAAAARVGKACERAREAGKFCSVWKTISRRDKKSVPDITAIVKKELRKL